MEETEIRWEEKDHVLYALFAERVDASSRQELEEKFKRCKPFRITFYGFRDRYGVECPDITVRPDTDTDKIVLCLRSDYVRNAILEYRRP